MNFLELDTKSIHPLKFAIGVLSPRATAKLSKMIHIKKQNVGKIHKSPIFR